MKRRRKYYTVKEWNRLSIIRQGYECKHFDVILKDYDVRAALYKNAFKNFVKKFNNKNLDVALKKLDKTLDSISKGIDEFGKMSREFSVGMGKRDYSVLMGDSKKRDYSALTGKNRKRDYSFLIGKKS